MKKGQLNQHQVANVKQTIINFKKAYNRINHKLQIIISQNTKHIDIAGEVSLKRQVKAEH